MNLIRPSFSIIEQKPDLQGIYDIIEDAGKTSYKSDVFGGEIAKQFVEFRQKDKHYAVLEFGTVYLKIRCTDGNLIEKEEIVRWYKSNKYSVVNKSIELEPVAGITFYVPVYYITTNYRVLVENGRLNDLKYLCSEPTPMHEKRYCVRFILDRFTGEEFLRHRVFSFCRESTRYCNYSKDKFNNSITFIIPSWIPKPELFEGENVVNIEGAWTSDKRIIRIENDSKIDEWLHAIQYVERAYLRLVSENENPAWQAQQARTILPCAIKSPLAMCGFAHDWIHFFHLRALGTTGAPHPQAKELAEPLMQEFIKRGYLTEEQIKDAI